MKGARPEICPPSLLNHAATPPLVRALLVKSWQLHRAHSWLPAERCARDAWDLCVESGSAVDGALAQLHLADFLCDVGEIEQALKLCREAHETLRQQPALAQRHNEAVAAYALGHLCQVETLGSSGEALHWHQEALRLFETAQGHWQTLASLKELEATSPRERYLSRLRQLLAVTFDAQELWTLSSDLGVAVGGAPGVDKVGMAERLVEELAGRDALAELAELGRRLRPFLPWAESDGGGERSVVAPDVPADQLKQNLNHCRNARGWIGKQLDQDVKRRTGRAWQYVFDVWPAGDGGEPFPPKERTEGYVVSDDRVEIGDGAYALEAPIVPDRAHYYFALPVQEELTVPGTRAGDYLLVRQQWKVDGQATKVEPGVVWEPGVGWRAVGFKREQDGRVRFYRRRARRVKIIGEDTDPAGKMKGYVVGVLRPEK